jgi:hypothetical protein
MRWRHNELSVTLPIRTWRTAIRAAEDSLGEIDESIVITPPGLGSHTRRLRQFALQQIRELGPLTFGQVYIWPTHPNHS